MAELKMRVAEYETRFTAIMAEITSLKSGQIDDAILAELRGVLARKYGKRLLDSWVPDPADVRDSIEKGSPTEEELAKEAEPAIEVPVQDVSMEEVKPEEEVEVAPEPVIEDNVVEEVVPPAAAVAVSPLGSDLSPVPSGDGDATPEPELPKARANKRKAATQPRGNPPRKRLGRRNAKDSPAPTAGDSDAPVDSETVLASDPVEDKPEPSDDVQGRRSSRREVLAKGAASKESSPAVSRRAPSVSSTTSAVPAAAPKRGRPPGKGKKAAREQTVESVKEEEDVSHEEIRTRRTSRRKAEADEGEDDEEQPERRSTRADNADKVEEKAPRPKRGSLRNIGQQSSA